ncbi:MAG: threonine-phosphate decarboxylase [Litoreibacter sp.]
MIRDHGGGLDAAIATYGGQRAYWLDLSTGINPVPYPVGHIPSDAWTALPDTDAQRRLTRAARAFWNVPDAAEIVAAPGASALIARIPSLVDENEAYIPTPTYNEHAAAFRAAKYEVSDIPHAQQGVQVFVSPNNPTGDFAPTENTFDRRLNIIDESFCDISPEHSLIKHSSKPGVLILKSFGKFWGLAGVRLGFAIAHASTLSSLEDTAHSQSRSSMKDMLGPWPVAGPALEIGARALEDFAWAKATRARLANDALRLDTIMQKSGAQIVGGTDLFRLYEVNDAPAWQNRLASNHVWSRIFPYSNRWLRLGLPAPAQWAQLEAAL